MVAAAAAQWPRRPHHPHRTSPTPLAALRHPAGQLQPRPPEAHSTTSRSRPCGLRHPLPRLQTGLLWPPNRPPQNQGPTLPWRQRDKGGPSPLPEARAPWGGGEDVSVGPFTLPLSAPTHPRALEGRDWTLARQSCASMHSCTHASSQRRHPSSHGFDSKVAWVPGGQRLGDQAAIPMKTHLPGPTTWSVSENHLVEETWLTPVLGPIGLDPHPWECRAFSACVRVAVSMYLYVCRSSKAT